MIRPVGQGRALPVRGVHRVFQQALGIVHKHRQAGYFLIAPAVCVALFWRAPFIWFRNDDFAWLGIPLEVHNIRDLFHVLFVPRAQGTIRVLSERLFFLVFASVFGIHALPFRICALATWFANLTLAALIGTRLMRSRAAGVLAAVLWTANGAIVLPLVWASTYNEVLCALCILLAFYARLRFLESGRRGWRITEWAAYLAGFGALEIIVMYPFIALLHALCLDRRREDVDSPRNQGWLATWPLFIPAVIFTAVHFFLIPKTEGPYYSLSVDQRLPATFLNYVNWALAPGLIKVTPDWWRSLGLISAPLTGIALLAFAAWRARHRDFLPAFCIGWFVLLIAPVLPLPQNVSDYYLTMPVLGLAWLAGWGIVSAWRATGVGGAFARAAAVTLVAAYLTGSIHEIAFATVWNYDRGDRMRVLCEAVDDVERTHPGTAILLSGVDEDLFQSGLQDYPFRLYGVQYTYLAPGEENGLSSRLDLGGLAHFIITPPKALALLDRGKARVLALSADQVTDSTRAYAAVLRSHLQPRGNFVDVGDPNYAAQLGDTWFTPDGGARWMPASATVKLSGIDPAARKLYVTGYAPASVIAAGPITLSFLGNGREIGSAVMKKPDDRFSLAFPLPAALIGRSSVEISIHASKTVRVPGDRRDLSVVFGTFSIR
jgi:hypothetical protein